MLFIFQIVVSAVKCHNKHDTFHLFVIRANAVKDRCQSDPSDIQRHLRLCLVKLKNKYVFWLNLKLKVGETEIYSMWDTV